MTTRKKKTTVTQMIPTPTPEKKKVNLKDPQGMKVSVPDNMVINKREDYTNLSIEDDSDDFLLYNMKYISIMRMSCHGGRMNIRSE